MTEFLSKSSKKALQSFRGTHGDLKGTHSDKGGKIRGHENRKNAYLGVLNSHAMVERKQVEIGDKERRNGCGRGETLFSRFSKVVIGT